MPRVKHRLPGFAAPVQKPEPPRSPTFGQALDSAFALENDVRNLIDFMGRPTYEPDIEFNLPEGLREIEMWDRRDAFLGVQSRAEMLDTAARIRQEDEHREILSAYGFGGLVMAMGAGVLSPTSLIPLTAGAKGAKAFAQGAALGAAAGGAQEAVLFGAQETRTAGEAVAGVAAATVLGGVLGGTVGNLSRRARAHAAYDMANSPRETTISETPAFMRGTDGDAVVLRPARGTYRFSRSEELPLEGEGAVVIRPEAPGAPGRVSYEFTPGNALVVTPESLPLLRQALGADPTPEALAKYAVDQGHDAVVFEGYDVVRQAVAEDYGPVQSVRYQDLRPEDQAAILESGKELRRRKDGQPRGDARVSPADIAEARARTEGTLPIPDEIVVLDRAKLRAVDDVDALPVQPRFGAGVAHLPSSVAAANVGAAAAAAPSAGALKAGAANVLSFIGPVTRVIQQTRFRHARWMMGQLSDAGMRMELNAAGISTALGGTAENRAKQWMGSYYRATEEIDRQYNDYFFNGQTPERFARQRAFVGQLNRGEKLSKHEFRQEISKALRAGEHDIPQVMQAAAAVRKEVYDPGLEQLQSVGLLPDEVKVLADPEYLNRVYNKATIETRPNEFVERLAAHFNNDLGEEFQRRLAAFREAARREEQAVQDLSLDLDEAEELAKRMRDDLKQMDTIPDEGQPIDPNLYREAQIRDLRDAARIEGIDREERKRLLAQARELEKDENFQGFRTTKAELRRRIRNLNRNRFVFAEKQRAKFARIERIEENQINSLNRVARKGQIVLRQMERYDDARLDTEVTRLRNMFEDAAQRYDRGEERLFKLANEDEDLARRLREAEAEPLPEAEFVPVEGGYTVAFGRAQGGTIAKLGDKKWQATSAQGKDLGTFKSRSAASEELGKVVKAERFRDPLPEDRALSERARQVDRADRLSDIANRLGEAEGMDRAALRALIDEGLQELIVKVNRVNSKRALRAERLREQARQLDPEIIQREIEGAPGRIQARRLDLEESLRLRGAEDVDLDAGTVNFSTYARERAEEVKDKILGEELRLAGMDIISGPRGPELARVLSIPSAEIEEFLENDIEFLIRVYLRTVAPDVEITRKLGNPNGALEFARLQDEKNARLREVSERKLPQDETDREARRINQEYASVLQDLEGVIGRLRHTWGVPTNPMAWSTRAARMMLNLNVLRFMGMVTVSSIPDVARTVQRHGLQRTFRDGFLPMINGFKELRISQREAKLAGTALDPVLHTRARQMLEITDDLHHRGTKLERGIEYATNRIGILAVFDYWTSAMKQLTSGIVNTKLLDSIDLALNGNGTAKEIAEATEFLSAMGIDGTYAERIWRQVTEEGGGAKVNGVWLPNTESWVDDEARRAYRAALAGEIDATIITPGVERPLWMDATMAGRLVGQFKSFAMSSTTKTLMAGLQQRDMAFVSGTMLSLAMGSLSYYLWAVAAGGQAFEDMMNADPDKWIDEAIDRSGTLAVFSVGREIMQGVPGARNAAEAFAPLGIFSSFSGEQSTRRGGRNLVESVGGPSFDALSKAARIISDIDDPTRSTLHAFRGLLPLQNTFYFRQLLDAIEDAIDLPESRR